VPRDGVIAFGYLREKRDAFDRLAALVQRIVNPPADNVVPFSGVGGRPA
jgi:hypothetical protein